MRYPVRTKIILYSLIPILSAYAVLFGLGLGELREQAQVDAERWLQEHASNHAYRIQLELTNLAEATRHLASRIQPEQPGHLQIAALLDRLAGTSQATAAGVQWEDGGWWMRRGEAAADALPEAQRDRAPERAGWHVPPDGSPGIRYRYPVRRNGALLGSVFLQMAPQNLHRLLHEQVEYDHDIYLLDSDGRYLLHPDIRHIGRSLLDDIGNRKGWQSPPTWQALIADHVARPVSLPGWNGSQTPHLLAAVAIDGSDWWLAQVAGRESLLQPARERMWWATTLLVVSLAVVILTIVLTTGHALRPLELLAASARRIADGRPAGALPPAGNDEIGRLAGAIRAILERQQGHSHEARAAYEELQARMRARTRELGELIDRDREQQHQLRQARDQAEAANRAKSDFLSNMSHELRTPLNGVLGYTQILRRDRQITPRQRENLEAIESCGQHLLTLINDVLDLSRIEAGRMQLDMGPVALPRLFREVRDIVAQRAHGKGLTLYLELAPDLPQAIETDATRLRQILLNLLGNAVKFTRQGGITLRAWCDSGLLHFEVEDTGVGIAEHEIAAIFDSFHQVGAGVSSGGSGLGLAINQRLLELLGGTPMQVHSRLGEGSRFHFSLPLIEADTASATDAAHAFSDDARLRLASGQAKRLMVVDDQAENRDILQQLLGDAGFSVEAFGDARQALARLHEAPFDLVLLDIRMPDIDGLEAARQIREAPTLRSLVLVAVTASVLPTFREQALASGFDDFIGKPLHAGELLQMLQRHLGVRYIDDAADTAVTAMPAIAPDLAAALCERIAQALELGDMGQLAQLGDSIEDVPEAVAERIASLARRFDFDGLQALCEQLHESD